MKFIVDNENLPLLTGKSEPRCTCSDGKRKIGHKPRFTRFRRRDDVHRLTYSKKTVNKDRFHLRKRRHKLPKCASLARFILFLLWK